MKYTAEEVRDYADACRLAHRGPAIADMLTELAERIKVDESAAPVGFVMEATATRHKFGLLTQDLPPGAELFTHPPAQVEPTEAVICKAAEVFLDAAPEWNDYLVKDGMRAALLAVWPVAAEPAHYTPRNHPADRACKPADSGRVAAALRGLLEIGKRNLINPKYDGFWNEAHAAIAAQGQPAERVLDGWRATRDNHTRVWTVHTPSGDSIGIFDRAAGPAADVLRQLARHLAAAPHPGDKPFECSGDPSSCPDNEGRGCYCSDARREGEPS